MLKIVILIFAALVVSTVDASDSTDRLRSVQDRLESYLKTEIDKLSEKYNTAFSTVVRITRNLSYLADLTDLNPYDQVRPIWNKVKEDTRELRVKTLIIGGAEDCDKIGDSIYFECRTSLRYKHECIIYRLDLFRQKAKMKMTYERLYDALIDFGVTIGTCARMINTTTEVESAISCTEMIRTQAELFISNNNLPVNMWTEEVNNLQYSRLKEACAYGFDNYKMLAANLTEKVIECYHRFLPITLDPTEATTLQATDEVGAN